ncbi:MAG: 1-acyl-sn-glycerol-3-phosphate acyltransferase [Flavobacteriales bacterium]|nr:1-acyl-sn-glycerol-3-phosphate acyltransferase [Flavobacteriales bacterium]
MRRLTRVLRFAWAVYFLILFCLFFLLLYPLFRMLLSREKWYPAAHRLRAIWGYLIMGLSGLFPKTYFEFRPLKNRAYIFVANHFSYLDILSLNVQLPVFFRFMAKEELAGIPLFSIFFRTIDIPVDRNSVKGALRAFEEAARSLDRGTSLGIFPEGGIGEEIPTMRRFKSGAFRLAIEKGIPLVPVTIVDNWKRLPSGGTDNGGSPGRMRMIVHKPIETEGLTSEDIPRVSSEIYSLIQNTFNSYNFADSDEDNTGKDR